MKKITVMICAAVVALMINACGGSSGYNRQTCESLYEKIEKDEPLDDGDYSEMITQLAAASKEIEKKNKEVGDDKTKLAADKEAVEMGKYAFTFLLYLGMHESELSKDNLKKLREIDKEFSKIDK